MKKSIFEGLIKKIIISVMFLSMIACAFLTENASAESITETVSNKMNEIINLKIEEEGVMQETDEDAAITEDSEPTSVIMSMDGDGTESNPYKVTTAADLVAITSNLTAYYTLEADIDLSSYASWNPIGTVGSSVNFFSGVFDGNNHTISNLTCNVTNKEYRGLFGRNNGTIKNVKLSNVTVRGQNYVGALVGQNYVSGKVLNCSVEDGTVIGSNQYIGGLVGTNVGTIQNSYATVNVQGVSYAGGLVGFTGAGSNINKCYATGNATVTNAYSGGLIGFVYISNQSGTVNISECYAIGKAKGTTNVGGIIGCVTNSISGGSHTASITISNVFGTGNAEGSNFVAAGIGNVSRATYSSGMSNININNIYATGRVLAPTNVSTIGGLIGSCTEVLNNSTNRGETKIANSYYSTSSTRMNTSAGGEGVLYSQLQESATYSDWDFSTIWAIDEGTSTAYLRNLTKPESVTQGLYGNGSEEAPYKIRTVEELANIKNDLSGYFILDADIDLSEIEDWTPIGDQSNPFTGYFDGNNHTISNLTIKKSVNYKGLFGYANGTTFKNVQLRNVNTTYYNNYTGALVGYLINGNVTDCNVEDGRINVGHYSGGLCGYVSGTMSNCYSKIDVYGNNIHVGGLVGYLFGTGYNLYSTGIVSCGSGTTNSGDGVGGLIGALQGSLYNSYSSSEVYSGSSGQNVGGLIGQLTCNNSILTYNVEKCYATGNVRSSRNSTPNYVGGLIGLVSAGASSAYTADVTVNLSNMFSTGNVEGWTCGSAIGNVSASGIVVNTTTTRIATVNINNIYSKGNTRNTSNNSVNIKTNKSGLIKYRGTANGGQINVTNSYYARKSTLSYSSNGGTGLLLNDMKQKSSFQDWDFNEVWALDLDGKSTPYLADLPKPDSIKFIQAGEGTEDNPYIINTFEDFKLVQYDLDSYYILNADLNFTGANWEPVGTYNIPFTGELAGNEHTISNLNIHSNKQCLGLFGRTNGTISNLKLLNVDIHTHNLGYVGAIAGYANCIQNCSAENVTIYGDINYAGGLAGQVDNTVDECFASVNITTDGRYVGGLVGYSYRGTVQNSYSTGNIEIIDGELKYAEVGGLIGVTSGSVSASYSTVNIELKKDVETGSINSAGGLIGRVYNNSDNSIIIEKCYATGNVKGYENVGGIIGYIDNYYVNKDVTVQNVFATGNVEGITNVSAGIGHIDINRATRTDYTNYASIVDINHVYAIGEVTGETTGGLVALIENHNNTGRYYTSNSYWTPETTKQDSTAGSTAINKNHIVYMTNRRGYNNWDFDSVWTIKENGSSIAYLKDLPMPSSVLLNNISDVIYFDDGDGTEYNPYIITTAEQLQSLNNCTLEVYYKLDADIDLDNFAWKPIGNFKGFYGKLDGDNNEVSNIEVSSLERYMGVFKRNYGRINNLELNNISVSGLDYVGGLVGENSGELAYITLKNVAVSGYGYVGGLIGRSYGYLVKNCEVLSGTVESQATKIETTSYTGNYAGGLIGYSTANVENGKSGVNVNGTAYVGGLIGYRESGTITGGDITQSQIIATGDYAGGFIGYNNVGNITDIDIYSIKVKGVNYIGGLVGYTKASIGSVNISGSVIATGNYIGGIVGSCEGVLINDVNSNANVSGVNYVGGVAGYSRAEIRKSSAGRNVAGNDFVGGLVGSINNKIDECYATGRVNGRTNVGGLAGYSNGSVCLSYSTGDAIATGNNAGGLLGQFAIYTNGSTITLERSYATGGVAGVECVGGIVGLAYNRIPSTDTTEMSNYLEIKNVFATGEVEGTRYVSAGIGKVFKYAENAKKRVCFNFSNIYVTGKTTGDEHVGGFVGYYENGSTSGYAVFSIGNVYWTPETTKQDSTALSTSINKNHIVYMTSTRGYTDWDFEDIWDIEDNGSSLAYLRDLPKPNSVDLFTIKDVIRFTSGEGTEENPYVITTAEQLQSLNNCTLPVYYELGSNIDASDIEWKSIGLYKGFYGNLNGNDKTINNITVNGENYVGIFAINRGELYDFNLNNIDVTATGSQFAGGLVAYNYKNISGITANNITVTGNNYVGGFIGNHNCGNIENVLIENETISGSQYIGGLIGRGESSAALITNCETRSGTVTSATATISSVEPSATTYNGTYAGGLCGYTAGTFTDCKSSVSVKGENYVGGFVGFISGGTCTNCNFTGTVEGRDYVGGFIGHNQNVDLSNVNLENVNVKGNNYVGGLLGYATRTIESCSATGTVIGTTNYIGGLVGNLYGGNVIGANVDVEVIGNASVGGLVGTSSGKIQSSHSIGKVRGVNNVGGLVGNSSNSIESSYAKGNVTATGDYVGGLVGHTTSTISLCYSTGDVVGRNRVGGFIGQIGTVYDRTLTIEKNYATGSATGVDSVGGFIGYIYNYMSEESNTQRSNDYIIRNIFATGKVEGETNVSAGIGYIYMRSYNGYKKPNLSFSNFYAIGEVTGDSYTGGIIGCFNRFTGTYSMNNIYWTPETVKQDSTQGPNTINKNHIVYMTNQRGYTDWDFENIWTIEEDGSSIAYLKDLPKPDSVIVNNMSDVIKFASGEGTEENPYSIKTSEQLQSLNNCTLHVYYRLDESIDLANVEWKPIGNYKGFYGDLDGDYSTISNLTINREEDYLGLFKYNYGKIYNFYLDDVNITGQKNIGALCAVNYGEINEVYIPNEQISGVQYVGGLVGYNNNKIKEAYIENGTISGNSIVGGLVGYTGGSNSEIIDSRTQAGTVTATAITIALEMPTATTYNGDNVGGLAGSTEGKITNSRADMNVEGVKNVGGLTGYNNWGTYTDCIVTGRVNATGDNAGGFIGYSYAGNLAGLNIENANVTGLNYVGGLVGQYTQATSFTDSSATGVVRGQNYVGGLVGLAQAPIQTSHANVVVIGNQNVGGLVGATGGSSVSSVTYMGTIASSYAEGAVTGNQNVGGLVGSASYKVESSYATGTVNGVDSVGGLFGRVTSSANITLCYSTGNVIGTGDYAGGLIGLVNNSWSTIIVEKSYSTGDVQGNNQVGGIIGYVNDVITESGSTSRSSSITIRNLFGTGKVEGTSNVAAGIGKIYRRVSNSSKRIVLNISNIYAIGEVTGEEKLGGLVSEIEGINAGTYSIDNVYWAPETTLQDSSANVNNKVHKNNIANMTRQTGYVNWDFENIWQVDDDKSSIAYLQGLPKPDSVNVANMQHVIPYNLGNGVEDDPYIITNAEQLQGLNNNTLHVYYKLGDDINLANRNWKPIGDYIGFNGVLDGNDYKISNLTINSDNDRIAIFQVNNGDLINVHVNNMHITGRQEVGALVAYNTGNLDSCVAENVTIIGNGSVGGLIGHDCGDSNTIVNCEVKDSTIKSTELYVDETTTLTGNNAGGLVGYLNSGCNFENCKSNAKVEGTNYVGGLIGATEITKYNNEYKIQNNNCEEVDVTGNTGVGGLIGYVKSTAYALSISDLSVTSGKVSGVQAVGGVIGGIENVQISNCTANVKVEGTQYVGGIMGYMKNSTAHDFEIATVDVTGEDIVGGLVGYAESGTINNIGVKGGKINAKQHIGGLAGYSNGIITNCYSNMNISGEREIGGLVGKIYSSGKITNSYATGNVTGTIQCVGGLVGHCEGTIETSYATGNAKGNLYTGGLVGRIDLENKFVGSKVSKCYATGNAEGEEYVGGLVGECKMSIEEASSTVRSSSIEISNSFATGNVTGTASASAVIGGVTRSRSNGNKTLNINFSRLYGIGKVICQEDAGGVIGRLSSDVTGTTSISNIYWTPETTKQANSQGGSGVSKTHIVYLTNKTTYNAWDFNTIWEIEEDGSSLAYLKDLPKPESVVLSNISDVIYFDSGIGKTDDPYIIKTVEQFKALDNNSLNVAYKLGESIDFAGTDFEPIGAYAGFNGVLDGNAKIIRNITISKQEDNVGIFTTNKNKITNLKLNNINVKGMQTVGGLVAKNQGEVINCKITNATVEGNGNVGGLIGDTTNLSNVINNCEIKSGKIKSEAYTDETTTLSGQNVGGLIGNCASTIINCKANATVTGIDNVGGLIGYCSGAVTGGVSEDSVVTGNSYVGGLIGRTTTAIANSSVTGGSVTGNDYVGGLIATNGNTVTNCNTNTTVSGVNYVGGLIGKAYSTISGGSYSTGNVKATGDNVGGLIGELVGHVSLTYSTSNVESTGNNVGGLIGSLNLSNAGTLEFEKSYATGAIKGANNVGGLIGLLSCTNLVNSNTSANGTIKIENAFAAGSVEGEDGVAAGIGKVYRAGTNTYKACNINIKNIYAVGRVQGDDNTGGLVGVIEHSGCAGTYKVIHSYWTPETTLQETSAGTTVDTIGEKNTLEYMTLQEGYEDWDFENIWKLNEDGTSLAHLQGLSKPEGVLISVLEHAKNFDEGSGSRTNPFIIKNTNQLKLINNGLRANYKLAADIDLAGEDWVPIGNAEMPFKGSLDGNKKKISNLNLDTPEDYAGLFGVVVGDIFDLEVNNANVKGKDYVGIVAGKIKGNIVNVSAKGNVEGERYVGGLYGLAYTIDSTGGKNVVGGVDGRTTLEHPSFMGNVTGTENVGGMAGSADTAVIFFIATSNNETSGIKNVGGLVGQGKNLIIANAYSKGQVQGNENVGGIVGFAQANSQIRDLYSKSDIIGIKVDTPNGMKDSQRLGGIVGCLESGSIDSCVYGLQINIDEVNSEPSSIMSVNGKSSVSGDNNVGGLVGEQKYSTIRNAGTDAVVSAEGNNVGGLVGLVNYNSRITGSYSGGKVIGAQDNVGGIVGNVANTFGEKSFVIEKSYSEAEIEGNDNVGGMIGNLGRVGIINDSFVTSKVTGNEKVGGFIGNVTSAYNELCMNNVYAIGKITGNNATGGIIGNDTLPSRQKLKGVYWAADSTTQEDSCGGEKRNLDYLKYQEVYTDWDFDEIWQINEGVTTPYLKEIEPPINNVVADVSNRFIFDGGKGLPNDPFLISSAEGLQSINNNLVASYKLIDDIDCSSISDWKTIGDSKYTFTGTLDGDNYTISNVNIDSEENGIALFANNKGEIRNIVATNFDIKGKDNVAGIVAINEGILENVSIENSEIIGNDNVGGLIGENRTDVMNCSSNATIEGRNSVGGLIGLHTKGNISQVYSDADIKGNSNVGGLVGNVTGNINISESYSVGSIDATGNNIGGIVGRIYKNMGTESYISNVFTTSSVKGNKWVSAAFGYISSAYTPINIENVYAIGKTEATGVSAGLGINDNNNIVCTNSYWAADTTKQMDSIIGEKRNVNYLATKSAFVDWNFDDIWNIDEGNSLPYLRNLDAPNSIRLQNIPNKLEFAGGSGYEDDPYIIRTAEQLQGINTNPIAHYKLGSNINLSNVSDWVPIGEARHNFKGVLDGDSYKIYNLKVSSENNYVGLFGHNSGTIKNMEIDDFDITGNSYIAVIAAHNAGEITGVNIENSIVNGASGVAGASGVNDGNINNTNTVGVMVVGTGADIGGLVGLNRGTITNCDVNSIVNGDRNVGGAVGRIYNGSLIGINSSSVVTSSSDAAGGLLGRLENESIIQKSCSTGNVTGKSYVGGLIGYINMSGESEVSNCYSASLTSGDYVVSALIGTLNHNPKSVLRLSNMYAVGKVAGTTGTSGCVSQVINGTGRVYAQNLYWSPETTTQIYSANGIGEKRTVFELTKQATYENWDFDNIWQIDENQTFAYFKEKGIPSKIKLSNLNEVTELYNGEGTEENPFKIRTPEQLNAVRYLLDKYYELDADIDLSSYPNWVPIGRNGGNFTGTLKGKGHTISNITMNPEKDYTGLFAQNDGRIENINLNTSNVMGRRITGTLIGLNTGNVSNITLTNGIVAGTEYVGGIIGYNMGVLNNLSMTDSEVRGLKYVGGIVGGNSGEVEDCDLGSDVTIIRNGVVDNVTEEDIIGVNEEKHKPFALFYIKNTVVNKISDLIVEDKSYDPDEFELTEYTWVIKNSNNEVMQVLSDIEDIKNIEDDYPAGMYQLSLTVKNDKDVESGTASSTFRVVDAEASIADFEILKERVYINNNLQIQDNSYDPASLLMKKVWTVTNEEGEEIYQGSSPLIAYRNFGYGKYTMTLVITNSMGLVSDECSKDFYIVDDEEPPVVTVNIEEYAGELPIDIIINCKDGETGVYTHTYAFAEENAPLEWEDVTFGNTSKVKINQRGKDLYLHVIATDVAGNSSQDTVFGPYRVEYIDPVADFELNSKVVSKYRSLNIIDKSYDENGLNLVKYTWTIKNSQDEVVYEGTKEFTDYESLEHGKYTISLKVTNEIGLESEECTKSIEVVGDITPPTVIADYESLKRSEPFEIKIRMLDEESGFAWYRYAVIRDDEIFKDWTGTIPDDELVVSFEEENVRFYVEVEAADNEDNITDRIIYGPYKICDEHNPIADFEIEKTEVVQNEKLIVIDNSYDPEGYELVKYQWQISNEEGWNIGSSSLDAILEGTNFEPGDYTISLVVENEEGFKSVPCIKQFKVLGDVTPPIVTISPDRANVLYMTDEFNVVIDCKDDESGFKSFRYAITYEDADVIKWSDEITDSTTSLTFDPTELKAYVNVIAIDNAGNVSERYKAGPYAISDDPVASFEIEKFEITNYEQLQVTDNSYDPNGGEIVSHWWVIKNRDGEEVYSGTEMKTDFSESPTGRYTVYLTVTNDSGIESEECIKEFKIVKEQTPPIIRVTPETAESAEDIIVTVEATDSESGFNSFRYYVGYGSGNYIEYEENVTDNPMTITIHPTERDQYIKIYAKDNVGNESEAKECGPYILTKKPVANFDIRNERIQENQSLIVTDKSYDPEEKELVTYVWTVKDSEGNELYSGNEVPTDFSSYSIGTYTLSLVVTNEDDISSDERTKTFEVVYDNMAPVVTITPEEKYSADDIDITVECTDERSGFKSFRYAITYGDDAVTVWSDPVTDNPKVITITPVFRNAYISVIAEDNDGNTSILKKRGPYSFAERPIADFDITNNRIMKNEKLQIVNKSYDPHNEKIVDYTWSVIDSEENTIYTGKTVPIDFSNYEIGTYKLVLVATNESNIASKPCEKEFTIIERRVLPNIIVTPESKTSLENIDIDIEITDGDNAFAWYKYVLTYDEEPVSDWGDEIQNSKDTIQITEKGKATYLHIIAADTAGNVTSEKVCGPYLIRKPFVSFDIANNKISKYIGIKVTNILAEDVDGYTLTDVWTIKNSNGDVIFTGENPPIDYSSYEPGEYTLSLKRTDGNEMETDECVKPFELLPDSTAPVISVDNDSIQTEGAAKVVISVFEKESGLNYFKYAVTDSEQPVTDWGNEIKNTIEKVTIKEKEKNMYIHAFAVDNDGNQSQEYIFGPYFVAREEEPDKWKFGIKFIDESDNNIAISGLKFTISDDFRDYYNGQSETTDENGIFYLMYDDRVKNSFGDWYTLNINSNYDCGYQVPSSLGAHLFLASSEKEEDDEVRDHMEFYAGGSQIVEINDETKEYLRVIKVAQKNQSNGSYKVKVVKTDSLDRTIGVQDAKMSISIENEFGFKASKIDTTKTDGTIKFNKINGYGDIVISIKELEAPAGYFVSNDIHKISLHRDEKTGNIVETAYENFSEDNISVDNKKNLITIKVPNEMQPGYFNFVVNNTDGTNGLNGTFTIVPNDEDLFSKILSEENGLDDDDYIEEQLGENQYRANEYGRAYLNAVKMPEEEGIYSYRIIQVQAPEGYELNRNEYEVFIEFRKVNNVMRIVNVYLGEDCEGIEIDREMLSNQHIQINYINKIQAQEEPELSSEVYVVDNEYIDRIYPNTTIYNFVRNLNYVGDITITDAKGNSANVEDTEKYIGTSYTITITKGTESIVRKAVVVGDINYDGKVELPDANMITRSVIRLVTLNDIQMRAADITGNKEVNVADSSVVERFVIRLETKLFKMINEDN